MPKIKTHEQFVKKVEELFNKEYEVCSEFTFLNVAVKLKHVGGCGFTFEMIPTTILNGGSCKVCKPYVTRKVLENYKKSRQGIRVGRKPYINN